MKPSLFRPFLLAACVIAGLLLLGLLPEWGVGGWQSKPARLLSDLAPADSADTASAAAVVPVSADSCKPGVTCISDFAPDTIYNMEWFYAALDEAATRPVRIAFVGDSFIEADILTDALRDLLQARYGGSGPGFVTIDHVAVAGRQTITQRRSGFEMHSAVDRQHSVSLPGLSGYYFVHQGGGRVELQGNAEYSPRLARADVSQFLVLNHAAPLTLTATPAGGAPQSFTLGASPALQSATLTAPMAGITWTLTGGAGAVAYGLTLDAKTGIALDNLSLRGSTGLTIPAIPADHLRRLDDVRHYDLVVLQYGLNVMARGKRDYSAYATQVARMVTHLRAAMPRTAFLVVGVGDRGGKLSTGEVGTLPEVVPLLEAQADGAAQAGAAFWNTYAAMGGSGAMVQFANAKPPLAARDYTHISEEGGKRIARLLYDALVWGHELHRLKNNASQPQ